MTPEERAKKICQVNCFDPCAGECREFTAAQIREAVEEAERERAAKQALITGESYLLGGRLISNEELYKQPTDYIKEAKAEAYEDAAKIAEEGYFDDTSPKYIARKIRARAKDMNKRNSLGRFTEMGKE